MGYAYTWLPESDRNNLSRMEVFYGPHRIVSFLVSTPKQMIIEYRKEGSQTSINYKKRDVLVDANFVDVFCEDLKLLIRNHRGWIERLEVTGDGWARASAVTEVMGEAECMGILEEVMRACMRTMDPMIRQIFDTLETSLKSRQFPLPVSSVRLAPATLDQGLSLVNLFNQKELKSIEFHFEDKWISVDLASLVSFQTSNQQYRNRITVYLDVITQDNWLLLHKLKSIEMIHSLGVWYKTCLPENLSEMFPVRNENQSAHLPQIEWEPGKWSFTPPYDDTLSYFTYFLNETAVSSVSREVACQVFENPIIMERIMEHFQLYDIIRLRKISYGIRNCVDVVKPEPHIKSYSLMFALYSLKEESWKRCTTYMNIELMNKDSRAAEYYWSCPISDPWPPSDNFDVNTLFEQALDDFENNVKHQKTILEELEIVYFHNDKNHKQWVYFRSEKLAERIAELLARRSEPLKVRKLSIGAKYPWEVTSILSHIDKDSLKTIAFLKPLRKEYSRLSKSNKFELGDISNVEQWLNAEEFICTELTLMTPIQQANITHFAIVDVVVNTISSDDVSFLKTELVNSVAFNKFKIAFKGSTIDETLLTLIGQPYRNIPNVKMIWYFRGQTDPDYYLHIVLDTHNLEDRIRLLIVSRVEKEDTPFFQNQ